MVPKQIQQTSGSFVHCFETDISKFFSLIIGFKDHIKDNIKTLGPSWSPGASWYDIVIGSLKDQIPTNPLTDLIPDELIEDTIIRMLASITPILGKTNIGGTDVDISQECSDASWTYLIDMLVYQQFWAIQCKYISLTSLLKLDLAKLIECKFLPKKFISYHYFNDINLV